ncbi:MAG: hypothetical protein ACKO2G_07070 [Verrucomicrobiales bacterium]
MRILLTGFSLSIRAGHEPVSRQLARMLQARGHIVAASGSHPSQLPRVLKIDWTPIASDPSRLVERPDIIHACHLHDAFWALAALPGVPAVLHCGRDIHQSVMHPRIYRRLHSPCDSGQGAGSPDNVVQPDIDIVLPEEEDSLGPALERIYTEVIDEHAKARVDWDEEAAANLRYLQAIFPQLMAMEKLNPSTLLGWAAPLENRHAPANSPRRSF